MNTPFTRARSFLSSVALTLMATALQAATYYVSPAGSDTAAGTETEPFLTIQRGVDAAVAGDLVLVAPGTYATGTRTTLPASGYSRVVITKAITVRSTQGAGQTVIKGQADLSNPPLRFGPGCVRCVYMTDGVLDGFTLADGYANAGATGSDMTDPVKNGGGVYTPDDNRIPQVNNCIITRCGAYRGAGAHWSTLNNCTVISNYVNSTSGTGIFSCHVRNSIVMFNGDSNDENYPSAESSVDRSLFLYSCTSPAPGLNFYGENRDGGNNVIDDPLFTPGAFTLADDSPCINAGNNAYASGTLDAAGGARIQGGIVDMGAYERLSLLNPLTVINGNGSGSYSNGATVAISSFATNAWVVFEGWTGDVATVVSTAAASTTLTMPAMPITVVATYHELSLAQYLSTILGIPMPVTFDNVDFPDVDASVPEVRLGGIGDGQTAFVSTVYTNAGTLMFPWRVSSEAGYDRLVLLIDGAETNAISGFESGVVTQYVAGAGAHTITWAYIKDGSDSNGEDAGWVGEVTWIPEPLAAEFGVPGQPIAFPYGRPGAPLPFPYGFEACFLDTAAPAGAIDGAAAKLGGLDASGTPYFPDGSTNAVEAVIYGTGVFTFNWCSSNQLADVVIFTIDGVEAARKSGTKAGWVTFTTNLLTVGSHVVRWTYTKNGSLFAGEDAVWIDNVTWTPYTYTLTVENGSGSGSYFQGEQIEVTADPPPVGYQFDSWDGDTTALADVYAATTTLTMPGSDVTIRALYKLQTFAVTVINGRDAGAWPNPAYLDATGEPEGSYPAGALVRIVADPAPFGYTFDFWSASSPVVFSNDAADVSMFVMPDASVTVTANYRVQSAAEKLGDALTIHGQPLDISDFSPTGVVAVANGGIRYDDPVVQMGGPSVGAGQNVYLTTTNFTGNGYLFFWWYGDTESDVDGLTLEVNGEPYPYLGTFSDKDTNSVNGVRIWWGGHLWLENVTNVTWRYTRDETYTVHQNIVLLDRAIWVPEAMVDALGADSCVPNINHEYDPLFQGRSHMDGEFDFEGEDGGVTWDDNAPGGGGAIRFGSFGTVTNNLCAQVAVTNYGTGVLMWEWTSSSEGVYDNLGFYIDGTRTNWISGKLDGSWFTSWFAVTSDRFNGDDTLNIFNFRYQKDSDTSMFEDSAWLRNVTWYPTYKLTVNNGSVVGGVSMEDNYYVAGFPVTISANAPAAGYYFDRWTGDDVSMLGTAVTEPTPTFIMPDSDVTLTATYTTNAPAIPHYTLTVVNGTGSGSYTNGAIVAIEAADPALWYSFLGWAGDTNSVADPFSPSTTVQIGMSDLTVTAVYESLPVETLISMVLGVPQPVTSGNITAGNISLEPPTVTMGPISDLETAFFATVYTNAGTVIFPWAVDSEEGYDFFRFSVDGTNVLEASGVQSGILTNFVAGNGPHVLRWSYEKDVSDSAGADQAVVGEVTWIPDALAAELGTPGKTPYLPDGLAPIMLDEAPPAGAISNLAVRIGGGGTVADGGSATVGTVFSGAGTLAFHWRSSSEKGHDYLILTIDGQEAARISGTKDGWLLFETNLLTVAEHTVRWTFAKDSALSSGSDCGWVDSVTWSQFSFALTVENGSGSGTYAVGVSVPVAAAAPASGMEFAAWDGDIESLTDPALPSTTVTMPSRDITIRALYRAQTLSVTVINGRDAGAWPNAVHESTGEPEGVYPEGAEVRIVADEAPMWQTFDYWTSTNGAVFAASNAPITTFLMPANSVTVTAVYRAQTAAEKLAGALTIAGQDLNVTAFSTNGIVAESAGGVRYDDPVVKFGGASVGAGQHVDLTVTNFTGDGVLLLWWKGNAETAYDEIQVLVNGSSLVGAASGKNGTWKALTNRVSGATSITLRFARDGSYYVRDNTITIDRLTWIPQGLIDATGCDPAIPTINGESAIVAFDGQDGGVSWVNDAPGGNSAIRFGRFGYVNNNEHAMLSVTNYGTGILMWQWASSSEAVADRLDLWVDDEDLPSTWISGKEMSWSTASHVIKNGDTDRPTARKTKHTFLFDYSKDVDVSVFYDCAWMRDGTWTPTAKLTLDSATNTAYTLPAAFASIADVVEEASVYNVFPLGTQVSIQPDPPEDGYYFDSWAGDVYALNGSVNTATNTLTMPALDITLRATYTTNAPPSPSPLSPAPVAKITAMSIQPAVKQSLEATIGDSAMGASVVLLFEGQSQTDYTLEWSPSLQAGEAVWEPLPIVYREVLGDTPDGRRLIQVTAGIPAGIPQGFFRLKTP